MNREIRNIDKAFVAYDLMMNSMNKNIKHFLMDYFLLMKSEGISDSTSEEMVRLDNCIAYLVSIGFCTKGWMLWEIPTFYSHCFLNIENKQAFDLVVWDIGEVIVRFLNNASCEEDANSIEEAIDKYCMNNYLSGVLSSNDFNN